MGSRTSRLLVACCALGACAGPSLHVDNPGKHVVLVDGTLSPGGKLPFRYYGTTSWLALPADAPRRANAAPTVDFQHLPTRRTVAMPAPASPWIFPLDLPLELLARLANGNPDAHTEIVVERAPQEDRSTTEFLTAEMPALRQRAHAARVQR